MNIGPDRDADVQVGELFEYLVIALLSVNNYPLDDTWHLRGNLRRAGICDPVQLTALTEEDIVRRLVSAGFDRGAFMNELLASRLRSVGTYIVSRGLGTVEKILRNGGESQVSALLLPAKGVGPIVIGNFLLLRNR
jgi:hypothetical protein